MTKNEPIGATKLASAKEPMGATVLAGGQVDQDALRKTEEAVAFEWKPGDVILDLYEVRSVTEGFGEDAQEKNYHQGGFGRVYKVWHRAWRREMAVKTPRAETFIRQEQKDTFIRECETWINLGLHPHIAACHYVRELGGVPRVFSEYAAAGTLEEWIRSERLYAGDEQVALARILDMCIQFAWGLHYAHERGVIHQDVKPLNALLWDDGTLKVTDYGLAGARQKAGLAGMSPGMQTVMVSMGGMTPSHCSPEQAAGQVLDRRTDVWSWAVSVLEMFQGGVTWQTGSLTAAALEVFLKHGGKEEGIPVMPSAVAHLLRRCFQSNPADRPRTLEDCAKALCAMYEAEIGKPYRRAMPRGASDTADALNNRALSFIDLGKSDEAEKLFERALQLDKHHLAATYNRGLMQWRGAKIIDTDLFRCLEEIRTDHPDDASVECALGWTRMENADVVQAQVHFERAIKLGDHGETERGLEEARRLSQSVTGNPRTFGEHENGIHSAAFSSDGRFILTGSSDNKLRLLDVATGQCLRTFEGGGSNVAYSPNGRFALSVGYEKYKTTGVRLWDVTTGQCLRTHGIGADPVVFSPDGRFALSGAEDNTLRLWDVAGGQCLRTFDGHEKKIKAVAFSPDGRFALSGTETQSSTEEGKLRLWDVTTGTCLRTFEEGARCVAFSPDGRYALSAAWHRPLLLWDVATGRCLHTFEAGTDTIQSVAFSPNGRYALSGGWDGKLRVWDVAARRCLRTFEAYEKVIGAVAYSPDGRYALSGSFDQEVSGEVWKLSGKLRLWDVSLLEEKRTVSPWLYSIALTAEQALERERTHNSHLSRARQALEAGHIGEALAALTLARAVPGFERSHKSLELQARVGARCRIKSYGGGWLKRSFEGHKSRVECVTFSRDGRFALSGNGKEVRFWDVATGQCLRTVEVHADSWGSMAFSSDCRFALSGADRFANLFEKKSSPLVLQLWDVATGKCLRTLHGHEPLAISPDGRFALCGRGEKVDGPKPYVIHLSRFLLWDLDTGQCLHTFEGDNYVDGVDTLTFSPDGRFVLSGSNDNKIRLWDIATRECLRTFEGHTDWVKSVAFSPDGRFALSGSNDKTLRLWDVVTKQCLRTFEGHTDSVESSAFSPDGRFALSGSSDKTLRLWDVATGQCLRTFEDGAAPVAFSPDGRYALSGGGDNTVRLWEIDWEYEYDPKHDPEEALERQRTHNSHLSRARRALEAGQIGQALALLTLARAVRGFERSPASLELQARVGARCRIKSYGGGWMKRTLEGHEKHVRSVVFSPDGLVALSGDADTIRLWDVASGKCLRTLKHTGTDVAFSPDGRFALSGSHDLGLSGTHDLGKMRLWDLATGQCLRTFKGLAPMTFSPDGRFALFGCFNTLRLWDVATGQCLRAFEDAEVNSVAFSPDGRLALSAYKEVRLWDVATGKCVRTFGQLPRNSPISSAFDSVAFSPDGRFVLSDSTGLQLWDVATGECLRTFEGHEEVKSLAFSPNGRFALSGSYDKTLRLWDVATGQCLRTFEGHTSAVASVAFSPDCRFALSGGVDKTLRLWEIDWEYEYDPKHDPVLILKPLGVS